MKDMAGNPLRVGGYVAVASGSANLYFCRLTNVRPYLTGVTALPDGRGGWRRGSLWHGQLLRKDQVLAVTIDQLPARAYDLLLRMYKPHAKRSR